METDLLIIGGGPAGLHAALTADRAGARVVVADESFSLGGQLRQQTQWFSNLPGQYGYGKKRGTWVNEQLINQVGASNVQVLKKHTMIGSYLNGNIGVSDGDKTFEIQSRKSIIAPGAQEEAKVFPGWTLPGVMTAGAAQILINREKVLPGKRAVMVGSNDFSLEVARQLNSCGITVEAIVEEKNQIICSDGELVKTVENVPVYTNSTIEIVTGAGEVEHVVIQTPDGLKEVNADLVCIANGFSPILEPFEIMNCHFVYQKELGGWLAAYNIHLQTTNPSCYIAGNAAGITDFGSILLTGEIAALSALEAMGFISSAEGDEQKSRCWRELANLESEKVLKARTEMIADYHQKHELNLPDYFMKIRGGKMYG